MRYITRNDNKSPEASSECYSFLQNVYHSIAETLPDIRDPSITTSLVDSPSLLETEDSYRKKLTISGGPSAVIKRHLKKKGPRKYKAGIRVNRDREQTKEVKYLPPGRMKDYYIQMVNNDPEQGKRASFATFYRTWVGEFPHLLFRTKRQHLECSVCQRHRLLIKGFSNNMLARKQQTSYYEKHLRDQWRDRCTYWEIRSQSRLRWGPRGTLALIVDGMDQAKFAYPRSPVMGGKQWANFTRPRAHIVGIKIHGWGMFFGISRADAAKDSNHHLEMVAATLSTLQRKCGLSFSQMHLHIQSDNCVREVKNNTLARWCSSLVSRGQGWGGRNCFEARDWYCHSETFSIPIPAALQAHLLP